jgi:hypothetical protein
MAANLISVVMQFLTRGSKADHDRNAVGILISLMLSSAR